MPNNWLNICFTPTHKANTSAKSKEELFPLGYANSRQNYYFVYEIELANDSAFVGQSWDLEKLCVTPAPSKPMVVSLTELMQAAQ